MFVFFFSNCNTRVCEAKVELVVKFDAIISVDFENK